MFKFLVILMKVLAILCAGYVGGNEIEDLNATPQIFYRRRTNHFEKSGRILNDYENENENGAKIYQKFNVTQEGMQTVKNISAALRVVPGQPCVVLLDNRESVYENGEIYIKILLEDPDLNNDFWLMKFNNSGTSNILAKSNQDKTTFLSLLKFELAKTTNSLGAENITGGLAFFAILRAVRLLPIGGAIVLFTDRKVQDEDLAHLALKELSEKRIKLFAVWLGLYPSVGKEEVLLKEFAMVTGGGFFLGNAESTEVNYKKRRSIIVYRTGLRGSQHFMFPVDSKISEIYVAVTSVVDAVKLITPQGYTIDLLDGNDVKNFSLGSSSEKIGGNYEMRLNTAYTRTPIVGAWRLDVDSVSNAHVYNVTIFVQNDLSVNAQIINKNQTHNEAKILRLNIEGPFSAIEKVGFINHLGEELKYEVPFTLKASSYSRSDPAETITTKTIDVDGGNIPKDVFFVKIQGKDRLGNEFMRLARYESEINIRLQTITIEVGAGSELFVPPNKHSNVYFEVTNNVDQMVVVDFVCRDERWLLQGMTPRGARINPRQTVIVTVNIFAPLQGGSGYRDVITFSVRGTERIDKSTFLYVNNEKPVDNENPHVWFRFSSDCLDVLVGNCQDATWTMEATAQDSETGLMQFTSNPRGLSFPNGYTSGTKEQVTGYYSGSCCQSQIQLTALDLNNNRRVIVADAYYNAALSPAIIAAIVLGVLLFIALIIAIVLICRYRTRRSISIDLPTYRSPHGISTRH